MNLLIKIKLYRLSTIKNITCSLTQLTKVPRPSSNKTDSYLSKARLKSIPNILKRIKRARLLKTESSTTQSKYSIEILPFSSCKPISINKKKSVFLALIQGKRNLMELKLLMRCPLVGWELLGFWNSWKGLKQYMPMISLLLLINWWGITLTLTILMKPSWKWRWKMPTCCYRTRRKTFHLIS